MKHAPQRAWIAPRLPGATLCSSADWLTGRYAVSIAFFYEHTLDSIQLSSALERVLADFPVFAGRMMRVGTRARIEHAGGVPLETVTHRSSLSELIAAAQSPAPPSDLNTPLSVSKANRGAEPILGVRVTHTRDGGSVLGLTWHHPAGDMASFMLLMRAWSACASGQPHVRPLLVEDRQAYLDANLENGGAQHSQRRLSLTEFARLIGYVALRARDTRRVDLLLSDEQLEALRARLTQATGVRVSSNDALCAQLTHALYAMEGPSVRRKLMLVVNYRRRLGLPAELLGNMLGLVGVEVGGDQTAALAAAELRRKVDAFSASDLAHHAIRDFIERAGGLDATWRMVPEDVNPVRRNLVITSWRNFGVYDVSFDGRRPVYFDTLTSVPLPWYASVLDGPRGQGVRINLFLPQAIAQRLSTPQERARLFTQDLSQEQSA